MSGLHMTVTAEPDRKGGKKACARCGIPRKVHTGRNIRTCRDCNSVLTPEERKAWQ